MTQNSPPYNLTHIDGGAFCDRFFLGLYFTRRRTCEPTGKIEPQKKSVTEPPPSMCVSSQVHP